MELFKIEQCAGNKGCPNTLIDTSKLIEEIYRIAKEERITDVITSKIKGPVRQHHCFRVGVANCPNACSQVQILDFGIIGKVKIKIDQELCIDCGKCVGKCFERALLIENDKLNFNEKNCIGCGMCVKSCEKQAIKILDRGYKVLAGGKLGRHPMLAIEITNFATSDEVLSLFTMILRLYKKLSVAGERLGAIFQRLKINSFKDLQSCNFF